MNHGLHWLSKDVQDVRTMKYILRRASHKEWDEKERIVHIGYKAGRAELSNSFDKEFRATGLDIWPTGLYLALVHYFPITPPSFPLAVIMYILFHYMLEVCHLFLVLWGVIFKLQLRDWLWSQMRLWILDIETMPRVRDYEDSEVELNLLCIMIRTGTNRQCNMVTWIWMPLMNSDIWILGPQLLVLFV